MQTVPHVPTPHKSHRRAYGSHHRVTAAQKAEYVAESITAHGLRIDDVATWQRYGIAGNVAQQHLVLAALARSAAGGR